MSPLAPSSYREAKIEAAAANFETRALLHRPGFWRNQACDAVEINVDVYCAARRKLERSERNKCVGAAQVS